MRMEHDYLGGGFKYFLFSPRSLGEDSHFDEHIFQMGWFNHQLVIPSRKECFDGLLLAEGDSQADRERWLRCEEPLGVKKCCWSYLPLI